jgi:hypothetical protein
MSTTRQAPNSLLLAIEDSIATSVTEIAGLHVSHWHAAILNEIRPLAAEQTLSRDSRRIMRTDSKSFTGICER